MATFPCPMDLILNAHNSNDLIWATTVPVITLVSSNPVSNYATNNSKTASKAVIINLILLLLLLCVTGGTRCCRIATPHSNSVVKRTIVDTVTAPTTIDELTE